MFDNVVKRNVLKGFIMSTAQDFSVALINATSKDEVADVMKNFVPRFCGYEVSSVIIADGVLTINGLQTTDNGYSSHTNEIIILETELATCIDRIGKKHFCGLGPVDIEIIKNIVG